MRPFGTSVGLPSVAPAGGRRISVQAPLGPRLTGDDNARRAENPTEKNYPSKKIDICEGLAAMRGQTFRNQVLYQEILSLMALMPPMA